MLWGLGRPREEHGNVHEPWHMFVGIAPKQALLVTWQPHLT